MDTLGYGLLAALGVGGYFGVKSLTRPDRSDEQNGAISSQKFNTALTDTLAHYALPANFDNPATAAFLNSNQGLQLMSQIYAGQVTDNKGRSLTNNDRQWMTTMGARGDGNALSLLRPVQYGMNTAPYQPFGNYPAFDNYGYYAGDPANSYGYPSAPYYAYNNYGYGGYGNNYGYQASPYQNNNSYYNTPYQNYAPNQYAYY
ncbi:MAG: hypothetical protein V4691_03310 [Pseudomonadota bacterium]